MENALKHFKNIQDPRSIRNQKHPVMTLIGTTLLASLSGIDSFSGFADFTESHKEDLSPYFDFPSGAPGHDTYQRFCQLKKKGYFFHLTFLLLDSPDLAVSRVAERVKLGGHFVPEETIRRRFRSGLKNFFELYEPLADSWQMYDNSNIGGAISVASKINNERDIQNIEMWQSLVEIYDETSKK